MLLNVWLQLIIFCPELETKNKTKYITFFITVRLQKGIINFYQVCEVWQGRQARKFSKNPNFWSFKISQEISLRLGSSVRVWHSENSFATYRGGFYRLWIYAKSKIFIKVQKLFFRHDLKTGDEKNDWYTKL